MHSKETKNKATELNNSGLNISQISKMIGVDRSTIREWFAETKRYIKTKPINDEANFFERFESCSDLRAAYYYLLGQYLGDGSISRNSRTYALRIFATDKYVNIIDEIVNSMLMVLPCNRVYVTDKKGCKVVTINSNILPKLFPQHGIGKKHTRKIELTEWQLKYLDENSKYLARGLFQSDGCRYKLEYGNAYNFSNVSIDIHEIFQKCLLLNGIYYTFNESKARGNSSSIWNTNIYRKLEVEKAYAFLGEKS